MVGTRGSTVYRYYIPTPGRELLGRRETLVQARSRGDLCPDWNRVEKEGERRSRGMQLGDTQNTPVSKRQMQLKCQTVRDRIAS